MTNIYQQTEARTAQKESLQHIPPHMNFSEFSSPADLLLLTPPTILAEQLTLIDYAIFRDIEVCFIILFLFYFFVFICLFYINVLYKIIAKRVTKSELEQSRYQSMQVS